MQEDKRKLSIWVPASLYDRVLEAGYTSPTHAVIMGFEKLLKGDTGENTEAVRSQVQAEIESLTAENQRLRESLDIAPNLTEFIELRARYEETQRHNETLKNELERAGRDKEFIQTVYDNYMRQMQFLITQNVIAPPAQNTAEENEQKATDSVVPKAKESNNLIEKICKNCAKRFFTPNPRKETCSDACRSEFSRKNRKK